MRHTAKNLVKAIRYDLQSVKHGVWWRGMKIWKGLRDSIRIPQGFILYHLRGTEPQVDDSTYS